jgi:hypothetical protein
MKPGDVVTIADSLSFSINKDTTLDLDTGLPGIIVSKVNTHGFCHVQINICEKVHITTSVHKNRLELGEV